MNSFVSTMDSFVSEVFNAYIQRLTALGLDLTLTSIVGITLAVIILVILLLFSRRISTPNGNTDQNREPSPQDSTRRNSIASTDTTLTSDDDTSTTLTSDDDTIMAFGGGHRGGAPYSQADLDMIRDLTTAIRQQGSKPWRARMYAQLMHYHLEDPDVIKLTNSPKALSYAITAVIEHLRELGDEYI
ncbi:hypothetical protein AAE478_007007 [Parahypoxylon ruwenzoriense]